VEMNKVNNITIGFLLKLANRKSISNFVFISSVAVYGENYGLEISESSILAPKSNFGRSKRYGEIQINKWAQENDSNFLCLRLPLVLGRNPPGNLGKLIHSIKEGHHVYLYGNKARKSVVFSSDVSCFIEKWLLKSNKKSGAINLANMTTPTFNWIEQAIANDSQVSFYTKIPIGLFWVLIVFIRKNFGISVPIIGKLFYPLTFSDSLARQEFGYTSKELNQTTFNHELNSNY